MLFFTVTAACGSLPMLPSRTKQDCLDQAAKFSATCMFAPVALMATGQQDPSGEEGFYVNYRGYVAA